MRGYRWLLVLLALNAPACMNGVPTAPLVAIEPAEPSSDDDLEMVVVTEASDRDGSVLFYRTVWTRGGVQVVELDDRTTVPAEQTTSGEQWTVEVVAVDSDLELGEEAQATVEISNSAPTLTVSIFPSPAPSFSDLIATIDSSDADGNEVTVRTAWTVDGNARADLDDTLVVPSEETSPGETWVITATPNDGRTDGAPISAEVSIINELRPPGSALCGSTSSVANGVTRGVLCTAPLDLATKPASNDQLKWYPGPSQRIAP
ncbi:MAG: hypothetical protein CMP23_08025 [Rickettsiales bacterium]|nr:hypothetical protein [Rickettsiales bacterium]